MLVVVGTPVWRDVEPAGPDGRACRIALAAAACGAIVELVGKVGDDVAGDNLMLALARARVGHVAMLRDPARPTLILEPLDEDATSVVPDEIPVRAVAQATSGSVLDAADVALALRYLPAWDVIVATDDVDESLLPVVAEGAAFFDAQMIVLVAGDRSSIELPADATLLNAPDTDRDGAFATLVGTYAAALDGGASPDESFRAARGASWERQFS